jgi:uncharacterized protein (TIGR00369 family)
MTQPVDTIRERTIRWEDPKASAGIGLKLAGMDYLKAMASGELPPPPALVLIGASMGEIEEGRVTMRLVPAEFHYNPLGTVHGGIIATLLDTVMGCAVHSTLPAGRGYTTLEFKVNFARPVTVSAGELVAGGRNHHVGRQTAVAEAKLMDARGRLYATASTTCLIFDMK